MTVEPKMVEHRLRETLLGAGHTGRPVPRRLGCHHPQDRPPPPAGGGRRLRHGRPPACGRGRGHPGRGEGRQRRPPGRHRRAGAHPLDADDGGRRPAGAPHRHDRPARHDHGPSHRGGARHHGAPDDSRAAGDPDRGRRDPEELRPGPPALAGLPGRRGQGVPGRSGHLGPERGATDAGPSQVAVPYVADSVGGTVSLARARDGGIYYVTASTTERISEVDISHEDGGLVLEIQSPARAPSWPGPRSRVGPGVTSTPSRSTLAARAGCWWGWAVGT